METIIPECEKIGNPKMYAESETVTHNPVSNGISQQAAIPSANRSNATTVNNNIQTFRPTVQPAYQPPPVYKSHGAIMKNEAPARIIPIAALNPYQGRWAVKARVTAKGDLRRYNNAKGDGKVFSFDLDSDGGEGQTLQEMVDSGFSPVLAVKAGKVNDFSGKSIGTVSSTQLFIDPDSSEAKNLRSWFDREARDIVSESITRYFSSGPKNEIRKTISQINDEGLRRLDKPDWVTVKATITFVKTDNFCYTACPLTIGDNKQCNKKVTKSGNSKWQCDRSNQEFEEFDYRYLLQCQVQDHTGLTTVTAFQESGEEILGFPAKELYIMKYEAHDDDRFANVIKSRLFAEVLLKLKIKEELYGEEQKVKITVVKVDKLNYSSETKFLLDLIPKSTSFGGKMI